MPKRNGSHVPLVVGGVSFTLFELTPNIDTPGLSYTVQGADLVPGFEVQISGQRGDGTPFDVIGPSPTPVLVDQPLGDYLNLVGFPTEVYFWVTLTVRDAAGELVARAGPLATFIAES